MAASASPTRDSYSGTHPFQRPFMSMKLEKLAQKLFTGDYVPKVEHTEKRIRGVLGGYTVFDTTRALLVWEHKWFPSYWVPSDSYTTSAHIPPPNPIQTVDPSLAQISSIITENKSASALIVQKTSPSPLSGYMKIPQDSLDEWLEESSRLQFHAKDPYHRVDCLPTDRQIRVEIDGVVLADTAGKGGVMSLWETRFPGRWYLPRTSVAFNNLRPSSTKTGCPYKGQASYYDAIVNGKEYKDVAWWYEAPLPESAAIAGMLCFYPSMVDMWIDGNKAENAVLPSLGK